MGFKHVMTTSMFIVEQTEERMHFLMLAQSANVKHAALVINPVCHLPNSVFICSVRACIAKEAKEIHEENQAGKNKAAFRCIGGLLDFWDLEE